MGGGKAKSFTKFLLGRFLKLSSGSSRHREEEAERSPRYTARKIRPSDEDRPWLVGDPMVDKKASDFITKFHATRCMDPERQNREPVAPSSSLRHLLLEAAAACMYATVDRQKETGFDNGIRGRFYDELLVHV
ncbi:hypothetical protein HPP92_017446 [Vanilla planifolia]|uniref:Uncharacterized protein n=1 Tax=Vanilla planifolia TaxID=51239 RepID=A0A835QB49_VANPL|nr:hypothetical protein HPP92_017446 [Vanilla planifolia]